MRPVAQGRCLPCVPDRRSIPRSARKQSGALHGGDLSVYFRRTWRGHIADTCDATLKFPRVGVKLGRLRLVLRQLPIQVPRCLSRALKSHREAITSIHRQLRPGVVIDRAAGKDK